MWRPSFARAFGALSALLLLPNSVTADDHVHDNDRGLFNFVSRPDIRAPRWTVNVTAPELVTPGYWFVAGFEFLEARKPGRGWIGPHIYDGNGELVWSGASLVGNANTFDFRRSNVRGEDLITFMLRHEGNAYIMDESFEVREKVDLGTLGVDFDCHEFNFIENGTRAISTSMSRRDATKEQAAELDWAENCRVLFTGFRAFDTSTWEPLFEWNSFDHLSLNMSSYLDGGIANVCRDGWGWDFAHINSVDTDHHGDYYVSARHMDTIFKVSKDDGHVIWRLSGLNKEFGDFDMGDVRFSRQHNVRFRGLFDGTQEVISILDNALGQDSQQASHDSSRGMVIALDTTSNPMKATLLSTIDHPDGPGSYAPRRGNYQLLPNGHVFMGWSEQATHSEHTVDGRLVMEARLESEWLGNYRSYKFPLVGRPSEPPKAVSAAYASVNSTATLVHVSWNGATEIDHWNFYKTTETGEPMVPIMSKKKDGFETAMVWRGYASFVVAEAVDKNGEVLGRTEIVKTVEPGIEALSGAVADELYWMQELQGENEAWKGIDVYALPTRRRRSTGESILIFLFGVASATASAAAGWLLRSKGVMRRLQHLQYEAVSAQGEEKEEQEEQEERVDADEKNLQRRPTSVIRASGSKFSNRSLDTFYDSER